MSDATECNYCKWKWLKKRGYRRATKAERLKVWPPDRKRGITNRGVVMVDKEGKFCCWFSELPDHCCC